MSKTRIINTFRKYLQTETINLSYVERYLGGMSNYTYYVVVNNHEYVIRVANIAGKPFVNYAREKLHLFLVEPYDLSPKTLFYDTTTGNKISEYIPGNNISASLDQTDLASIAKVLRKLHSLPLEGVDIDKLATLNKFEKLCSGEIAANYYELKEVLFIELNTNYKNCEICFTHGDAQRSNIIKNDQNYFLVDFEFSGMNDPYFDIASFGNIDFNDSLLLLDHYLQRPAKEYEKRRVMVNRLYQVLQWHLVAQVKEEKGQSAKLHIDFKAASQKYLDLAKKLADKIKTLPLN